MIQLKTKYSDIKNSNLIFIAETISDLKKLDFLKLDSKVIANVSISLKWKENQIKEYFIWNKRFEKIIILVYRNNTESVVDAFGVKFRSLPDNFTSLSNCEKNDESLLNMSVLSKYTFSDYKSEKKAKEKPETYFLTSKTSEKQLEERINTLKCITNARDLWSIPASDLTPESFAKKIKSYKWKNSKVKILNSKDIDKKKLGLIQAVWKGSENKPYMVIIERIVDKKAPTYACVGKWITFDSGWVQVKPWDSMYEMKWDMCGAWAVFWMMQNLDKKKLNVNIIACICLAENAISSTSYRPSDILTSYSGKTVDVIHTDAEWRLVLADGVSYMSKNYKPSNIMTVATLTWACMMALWFRYAWVMWNDKKAISAILKQSKVSYEKYHELPFDSYFVEKCKSEIADLENLNRWVYAGSTMWGAFISHFCMHDEKYMHLDIAWAALNSYEPYGIANKWMTWFGVESISNYYLSL